MGKLLAHRGPDGAGHWVDDGQGIGFAHRRLSVIDLSDSGNQPMHGANGNVIIHNGEVYNYLELREALSPGWPFQSHSDTETILAAYEKYGTDCVEHLRGMFAFALWDGEKLFCARDRFGIKPFYYTVVDDVLYFGSEVKSLLPFLPEIETDKEAFGEYLTFQFVIGENTLFKGIKQLLPGHVLVVQGGQIKIERYWDIDYRIDWDQAPSSISERTRDLVQDSIEFHLRGDVPVGSYLSGGMDSSLVSTLAAGKGQDNREAFHAKFTCFPGYDESEFAERAAQSSGIQLRQRDISADDFINNISDVIYHLDYPTAGPGAFPQYMVSRLAGENVKVVLGGQGGDEIFGGYARYVLAYFEQCIKAAIDGTYQNGNFVVTAESIIPNLGVLQEYKPLIQKFWSEGLFGELDQRYFSLINRSKNLRDEIRWEELEPEKVYQSFLKIFNSERNVRKEALFDSMTHFDFKTLLPALLHVEDRMSMAHGLESRVPLLDHPLVEFLATVPADVKFKGGGVKHLLKDAFRDALPPEILNRRDKMGFPVPLNEWLQGDLREFLEDTFRSDKAKDRPLVRGDKVIEGLKNSEQFSRKSWGLLSLELWHQRFHDRAAEFRAMPQATDSEMADEALPTSVAE